MPMTPGLNPAIRQLMPMAEQQESFVELPEESSDAPAFTVENEDGSVSVRLDGKPMDKPSEA